MLARLRSYRRRFADGRRSTVRLDEQEESRRAKFLASPAHCDGATDTVLNGMTSATAPDTYAFFFANPTTMFVADPTDGIQEWTLTSGTWTNVATLTGSYVGLTGVQTGNTVTLYATTGTVLPRAG